MNTIDALMAFADGKDIPKDTPVRRNGYKPFRLASGKLTKKSQIVVVFEDGTQRHFTPNSIRYGSDTEHNRPVRHDR